MKNEEILHLMKKERKMLHAARRRKTKWTGNILGRNCLLKHVLEGKIEVAGRRGRRRSKQLLDGLKENRRQYTLKQKAQDRTLWRNRFGRG
jgi:hypothetical protein